MQLKKLYAWFDGWNPSLYTRYFEYKKRKIRAFKLIFDEYISAVRADSLLSRNGVIHEWYRDYLYFTKTVSIDYVHVDSSSIFSLPKHFNKKLNKAIKIPNANDNEILRHYWYMSLFFFCTLISFPLGGFILHYLAYEEMKIIAIHGYFAFISSNFFLLFFLTIEANTLLKIVPVPYVIFDNDIKSIIYRLNDIDEIIPYQQISFNIRQIEDSPAYCALEMEIHYSDKPSTKIIMDFCESHIEAQSISNTYRALLSGDEAIYHKKLKRFSSVYSDFNMSWWRSIYHFFNTTTNWHACVFPHYFGFRLRYGHPLGVLKKYIIEQEMKKPLKIS